MATLLTKSLFTTSLECPRKLYYATHAKEYTNTNSDNDFMRSLAEGGIQVGALARHYYRSKYNSFDYHYIETKDKDEALRLTTEAMKQKNVVIAEAAFEWEGCFVRADILVKRDKTINLIEVKSSSLHQKEVDKITEPTIKGEVNNGYRRHIYDLAFQKYIIQNALDKEVYGYLMLVNSDKECDIDGLNAMIRINTKTHMVDARDLEAYTPSPRESDWLLLPCDMDMVCNAIIDGTTTEQAKFMGATFTNYVDMLVDALQNDKPLSPRISSKCRSCEFRNNAEYTRSGFHCCWKEKLGFSDADFEKPLSIELWSGKADNFFAKQKYFLSDLKWEDFSTADHRPLSIGDTKFSTSTRKQIQIEKSISGDTDAVILPGIKDKMDSWNFPLHFIDFETATVALPFTKGQYPYKMIAFQYSHHQLDADGSLTHTEWISTERGFPNFAFVRALKHDLDKDDGSIFCYSHHENTVLLQIAEQLRYSQEVDKDELIAFIEDVTHEKKESNSKRNMVDPSKKERRGKRDMVDLRKMVLDFFYDPSTKGCNSIKMVLPAVLRSKELQKMYAKPYQEYVSSPNFAGFDFSLINYNDSGEVGNPYKYLPTIGAELLDEGESTDSEERINNGGLANANYAKLQYDGLSDEEKLKLRNALLRYCELDTMAMVLVYQYFKLNLQ